MTVVREDMNGTKASAMYTPTVIPVTTFVDKEGKAIPGYPTEDGEQPKLRSQATVSLKLRNCLMVILNMSMKK